MSASLISHGVDGWEQCLLCHDADPTLLLPTDHGGRDDDTCTACHDVQPRPAPPVPDAQLGDLGQAAWTEGSGQACGFCHGERAEGAYGPSLLDTTLSWEAFSQRTRSPLSSGMPPIPAAVDDPAYERSGVWIGEQDLQSIYLWLGGEQPDAELPLEGSDIPQVSHAVEGVAWEDCLFCHAHDRSMPVPYDHIGWTNGVCLSCHRTR